MYKENKDKGFEIVSIDGIGDSVDSIQEFIKQKGATFTVGSNNTPTDIVAAYKVTGYPTNFVIGRDGTIVAKVVGYNMRKLAAALAKAGIQ